MSKITWEIYRGASTVHGEVVANTRATAIAIAEAAWLQDTDWQRECVGMLNDDGTPFERCPIPEFKARKALNMRR